MQKNTKKDKFIELAENRVNKALATIDLIGNLSNTNNYEYTEEQVNAIFKALRESVKTNEAKFQNSLNKRKGGFKL